MLVNKLLQPALLLAAVKWGVWHATEDLISCFLAFVVWPPVLYTGAGSCVRICFPWRSGGNAPNGCVLWGRTWRTGMSMGLQGHTYHRARGTTGGLVASEMLRGHDI